MPPWAKSGLPPPEPPNGLSICPRMSEAETLSFKSLLTLQINNPLSEAKNTTDFFNNLLITKSDALLKIFTSKLLN